MTGRRRSSARAVSWWFLATLLITLLAVAGDIIRHAAILLPVGVIVGAAYMLRRRGRSRPAGPTRRWRGGRAGKMAVRGLEAAQRDRLVAELERLSSRSLDEITASYRQIARRHGGTP
jgi:hypothetical protein